MRLLLPVAVSSTFLIYDDALKVTDTVVLTDRIRQGITEGRTS